MEGMDGHGKTLSYCGVAGYNFDTISSSSGTVSTAYTRSSHVSSISMEAAKRFEYPDDNVLSLDEMEEDAYNMGQRLIKSVFDDEKKRYCEEMAKKKKKAEHITRLVQEFFGAQSANCSINGVGNIRGVERWLTELGVGWVLRVADGASTGELDHISAARSWSRALTKIMNSTRLMRSLFPHLVSMGLPSICEEIQFARFTQEAMLKMLAFVDVIVVPNNPYTTREILVRNGVPVLYRNIRTLLRVRGTVSAAITELQLLSNSESSTEVQRILDEMVGLLSSKEDKAGEAIWSTMEEIRTGILESMEDNDDSSWGTQIPQGSSGIHKATQSVTNHIRFVVGASSVIMSGSLDRIADDAVKVGKYVPLIGNVAPALTSLIVDMLSRLEETFAKKTGSFSDPSLRFIFLINNTYFLWDQLCSYAMVLKFHMPALIGKIDHYVESYLEASWAPVLSCLVNPTTPVCFGRSYSLLPKFESEFQKTYTTQKLWKVPDSMLRKRLRMAIVERVAPGYRKYLEDNDITTPKISPQEMEEMFLELFEG